MSKVWLITDGSRGFGRALAEAALASGHRVAAGTRDARVADTLRARHRTQWLPLELDLADEPSIYAAIDRVLREFGRIDAVVVHGGLVETCPIESMRDDDLRAHMETAFFGAVGITRAALPILREQGEGHFIQFAPVGVERGTPGFAAYHAANLAIRGYYEVLAREEAPHGTRVTIVEPDARHIDVLRLRRTSPTDAIASVRGGSPLDAAARHASLANICDAGGGKARVDKKIDDRGACARVLPFPSRPVAA